MGIPAIIPFKPVNPKTRLSCILDQPEREQFAETMLADVVNAVEEAGCDPLILSTHPYNFNRVPVREDPTGLNEALNAILAEERGPLLIIMADLPLATGEAVERMISTREDSAMVPGRGGGTNAIYLSRGDRFKVDYYGASFLKHRQIALDRGLSVEVVDSFRLHTDVDEKEDLVELLIHGTGLSRGFLEGLGFSLSIEKGRVGVVREGKASPD
jgi:2-phospho-L-lactate guanylyltransferase